MTRSHFLFILLATSTVMGTTTPKDYTITDETPSSATTDVLTSTTPRHTTTTSTTTPPPTTTSTTTPSTTTTTSTTTPSTTTTSTTTPSSTTTTTTTESPPEPLPAPTTLSYVYTDDKNVSCIVLQMAVQINVTYLTKDNQSAHSVFNLPANNHTSLVNGSCGNETQFLTLQWMSANMLPNNLTMKFHKNSTTKHFTISHIILAVQHFPNAASNSSLEYIGKQAIFATPLAMSYRCARAQQVNLTNDAVEETVAAASITFTHLQEQAFRTEKGRDFSSAMDCDTVNVPDVVPIAVGCALAALVLVVLAAYLIGRRRSQSRGYLSM